MRPVGVRWIDKGLKSVDTGPHSLVDLYRQCNIVPSAVRLKNKLSVSEVGREKVEPGDCAEDNIGAEEKLIGTLIPYYSAMSVPKEHSHCR